MAEIDEKPSLRISGARSGQAVLDMTLVLEAAVLVAKLITELPVAV